MAEWQDDPVAVQDWQADPLASESWKSDPIDTTRMAKREAMQKEMDVLRADNLADSIVTKIIEGTEGVVSKIAAPVPALLELPEHIARMAGVANPPSANVPALSPEAALKAVEFVTPGGAASEGTTGQAVQELAAGFISGSTTPAMVAGVMAGTKAPVAVGRVFQAEMLGHVPASVVAVAQAEPGQAKTKAALELGVNVALPALIEKGISRPVAKEILVERAAEVGPATEAVVKGKQATEAPAQPSVAPVATTGELVKPVEIAQPVSTEPPLPVITTEKPVSQGAPVERITELRAPVATARINDLTDPQILALAEDAGVKGTAKDLTLESRRAAVVGKLQELSDKGLLDRRAIETQPELVGMGAATPAEYAMSKGSPTGIKNATIDAERAKRDLPPAMEAGRQDWGEAWDRAMARIDKDPSTGTRMGWQDRLIAELSDKPRPATDVEQAALLHRNIELHHEYDKVIRAINQAADDGRLEDLALEEVRRSELSDKILDMYNIEDAVGTELGRGLAARKMMAYEDFSLAKMEVERRAAKGGEQLTPEERAEVVTLQKKIEETQKRYDDYVAKSQQQITALEVKAALAATTKTAQEMISPKIKAIAERIVNNLEREADAAWKRIQERGLTFGSGPLHELPNIKDFAIIGASKAVKAGVDFAQWSVSMTRQFGEGIKPHLERIWDESQKMLNSLEEMRPMAQESPKRRKQDPQAAKLHFEQAKAKKEWQEKLIEEKRKTLPALQKAFGMTGEVLNTTRAVMTSADLSAVLRQGGFITLAHPIRAVRSFPAMLRAFKSEANAHAVNLEIASRPNYPLYHQAKLYLSEHGHSLSKMEEAYMSRWAEKIPLVAGSQRAYTTFLNKLRADSFDAMSATLSRNGKLTPVEAEAIANFINVATGRGGLGKAQQAAVGLNTVFFAPRYVASRFQLLAGTPTWRGTAKTRTAIAKEYARYLMGLGVVYGLGKLAGAEIEGDPRSSDFGKMRFGNTRIDPMSGLQQVAVLESRLASGETKRISGKVVPIRGEKVPFGSGDASDVLKQFVRTKLSPVVGAGVDIAAGENVVGEPVTPGSVAQNLTVPLAFRDIYKAMLEQGIPEGTALGLLSILGMGVQTYDE